MQFSRAFIQVITVLALQFLSAIANAQTSEEGYWDRRFTMAQRNPVRCEVDEQGRLIAYGRALTMTLTPSEVAVFDGRYWMTLRTNNSSSGTIALETLNGRIYRSVDHRVEVERENAWELLPEMNGPVNALAFEGEDVVAGGGFTTAGTNNAHGVARWNGTAWAPYGDGLPGTVGTLLQTNGMLYAAWNPAEDSATVRISSWNGTNWSLIATCESLAGTAVSSMLWHDDALIIGGRFESLNALSITNSAMLRGETWEQLGSPALEGTIREMVAAGTNIYAARTYQPLGQTRGHSALAKLANGEWIDALQGRGWDGYSVCSRGADVFATSRGVPFAGSDYFGIWHFDGLNWSALINTPPVGTTLGKMASIGSSVILETSVGPAIWDGHQLREVEHSGTTVSLTRGTLVSLNGSVFGTAARSRANSVMTLTNGVWSDFSTAPATFSVMAAFNGHLVGIGNGQIYQLNGETWDRIGTFTGSIFTAGEFENRLYIGGEDITTGGAGPASIVAWDGSSWEAAPGAPSGRTLSLSAADRLYTSTLVASDPATNGIFAWDGTHWDTLAVTDKLPTSIAASEDGLVAIGGPFTTVNGSSIAGTAVLRGMNWVALEGAAVTSGQRSLLWIGHDLYMTGGFTSVGSVEANGIALWRDPGMKLLPSPHANDEVALPVTGAAPKNFIIEHTSDFVTWEPSGTNSFGNAGSAVRVSAPEANGIRAFRARVP